MSILKSGKLWPYAIGIAITMVFGFCVATVVVTSQADIQPSDDYMTYYQDADANVNSLINSRIAFDKKYKIEYITDGISKDNTTIEYKLTDLNGKLINDAVMIVAITRPETHEFNQKLNNPKIENGVYSFSNVKFPKEGIWNIVVKVVRGKDSRFFNLKADTRYKAVTQY